MGRPSAVPTVGWLIDHFGARESMFLCGAMVALVAIFSGMAMARRSHLKMELDLHRSSGRSPVHIVHSS